MWPKYKNCFFFKGLLERTELIKIPVCLRLLYVALDSNPRVLCCSMFQTHSYFCLLKQNACQPVAFKKNFRLANACNWIQRVRSIICSGYNLAVLAEGWTQQMDGCWLLAPSHRLCVWKQPNTPHLRVQRRAALSLSGPSPESTLRCEGQARNRLSKIIKKKKKSSRFNPRTVFLPGWENHSHASPQAELDCAHGNNTFIDFFSPPDTQEKILLELIMFEIILP